MCRFKRILTEIYCQLVRDRLPKPSKIVYASCTRRSLKSLPSLLKLCNLHTNQRLNSHLSSSLVALNSRLRSIKLNNLQIFVPSRSRLTHMRNCSSDFANSLLLLITMCIYVREFTFLMRWVWDERKHLHFIKSQKLFASSLLLPLLLFGLVCKGGRIWNFLSLARYGKESPSPSTINNANIFASDLLFNYVMREELAGWRVCERSAKV